MTDEQQALREAVARAICDTEWGDGIWDKPGLLSQMEQDAYNGLATAAIAVALERAAQVADTNALEAWEFGADETRGLMRLQAADIAAAIRALIPASGDATS